MDLWATYSHSEDEQTQQHMAKGLGCDANQSQEDCRWKRKIEPQRRDTANKKRGVFGIPDAEVDAYHTTLAAAK